MRCNELCAAQVWTRGVAQLVACLFWVQKVASSSLATPTKVANQWARKYAEIQVSN